MRTRFRLTLLLLISTPLASIACAARTEIADDEDDFDSSSPDAPHDVTVIDVTPPPPDDAFPPPPPIDASPPPPPDDAEPPPPIDAGPPPPPDDAGPPPPIDASPPPEDAGEPDSPTTTCPDECKSNHECENQCSPHLNFGRYCCDKLTETCFAFTGNFCPIEISDAGFD